MIGARIAYKKAKEASARSKKKRANQNSELISVISDLLNSEDDTFLKKKDALNIESNRVVASTLFEFEKPVLPENASFSEQILHKYLQFSWIVKEQITSKAWFEAFILICILSVAVSTGLSLDGYESGAVKKFDHWVASITFYVFVCEVVLKLISFGIKPYIYFVDKGGNGVFNCFDFVITGLSIALIGQSSAGAIRTLRLGRLVRLLTIIKNVPELKVIVIGLIAGLKSVVYIVALLILVIYLYAVLGVIVLSENDRAHFGTVSVAMITLFQISTLTSWTTIGYVSWHGCDTYTDGYVQVDDKTDLGTSKTMTGPLPTWECLKGKPQPLFTFIYFTSFTIVAAMVIMSLFIGVITMGMFDAVEQMKTMKAAQDYKAGVLKLKHDMFPLEGEGNSLTLAVDRAMKRWPTRMNEHRFINVGWRKDLNTLCQRAKTLEDSKYFNLFITICIAVSGIVIGLQVDNVGDVVVLEAVDLATLLVFTFEIIVKTVALKDQPWLYFKNPWNRFDLLIVTNGWLDFFKLSISKSVSILRLLRMLRVFRLAKALPRLRSIVESLIKGFGSVLWILILMIIFNYISGCLGILLFQENDPFYFGSVLQSLFSVYQIETLDSWDIMLRVNMYGCNQFSGGYPLTIDSDRLDCADRTQGLGWLAAAYFIFVVVFGGLILPTMLIGIVTISFEESFRQSEIEIKNQVEAKLMISMVQEDMPMFFSDVRVELLKFVFASIDVDDSGSLDINEVAPLIRYISSKHLKIDLKSEDIRSLVLLFDDDNTDDINFGELLVIIRYIIRARNLGKLVRRSSRGKDALQWGAAKIRTQLEKSQKLREQVNQSDDRSETSDISHISEITQVTDVSDKPDHNHQKQLFDRDDPSSLFRAADQSKNKNQEQQPSDGTRAQMSKQLSMTSLDETTDSEEGEEEGDDDDDSIKEMEMEKFSLTARKKQQRSSYIRNMVSDEFESEEKEQKAIAREIRRNSRKASLETISTSDGPGTSLDEFKEEQPSIDVNTSQPVIMVSPKSVPAPAPSPHREMRRSSTGSSGKLRRRASSESPNRMHAISNESLNRIRTSTESIGRRNSLEREEQEPIRKLKHRRASLVSDSYTVDLDMGLFELLEFDDHCTLRAKTKSGELAPVVHGIEHGHRIVCMNNEPVKTANDIKLKLSKLKKLGDEVVGVVVLIPIGDGVRTPPPLQDTTSLEKLFNNDLQIVDFKNSPKKQKNKLTPLVILDPAETISSEHYDENELGEEEGQVVLKVQSAEDKLSELRTYPKESSPSSAVSYVGSLPPLTPISQMEQEVMHHLTVKTLQKTSTTNNELKEQHDDLSDEQRRTNEENQTQNNDTPMSDRGENENVTNVESLQHLIKKLYFKISMQKTQMSKQKQQYKKIARELKIQKLVNKKYADDVDRLQSMNESLLVIASLKSDEDDLDEDVSSLFPPNTPGFTPMSSSSLKTPKSTNGRSSSSHKKQNRFQKKNSIKTPKKKVVPEPYVDSLRGAQDKSRTVFSFDDPNPHLRSPIRRLSKEDSFSPLKENQEDKGESKNTYHVDQETQQLSNEEEGDSECSDL